MLHLALVHFDMASFFGAWHAMSAMFAHPMSTGASSGG